jgi:hypothetical protein
VDLDLGKFGEFDASSSSGVKFLGPKSYKSTEFKRANLKSWSAMVTMLHGHLIVLEFSPQSWSFDPVLTRQRGRKGAMYTVIDHVSRVGQTASRVLELFSQAQRAVMRPRDRCVRRKATHYPTRSCTTRRQTPTKCTFTFPQKINSLV